MYQIIHLVKLLQHQLPYNTATTTTPTGQTDGTTSTVGPGTFPKGPDGKCPTGTAETSVGVCVGPGTSQSTTTLPGGSTTSTTPTEVEVPKNSDGTCPAGSHIVGFGGKTGSNAPSGSKCISDNPPNQTPSPPPMEVPTNADGTCPPGYMSLRLWS